MQRNNHSTLKSLCLLVAGVLVAGASLVAVLEVRAGVTTDSVGPDVTIYNLTDTARYGPTGDFVAYAVGTNSCNVGTVPVGWCDNGGESGCGAGTTFRDHPVIAQNLYRLKDDRFQQLGMSWLKHGFLSTNSFQSDCQGNGGTQTCTTPPLGSDQLGIGCTDIYGAGLNGSQGNGPRSEVNPTTGDFPMPHGPATGSGSLYARIIVPTADVDPAQNAGAHYWVEGQYVAPDDAKAVNGFNNASYRKVTVGANPFNLSFGANQTVRENTAIEAWAAFDTAVELVHVDFLNSDVTILERFTVARKVVDLGGGNYRYEYAIHNMNSVTGARGFTIQFPANVTLSNVGFYDVDHHSGEPYSNIDWVSTTTADTVEWTLDPGDTGPDDNALRWATMYSFWFEANADSTGLLHSIDVDGAVPFDFNGVITEIFTDGFESGDTSAWSLTLP